VLQFLSVVYRWAAALSAKRPGETGKVGGAVAQLGARLDGIEEVVGSNPIGSTNKSSCYVWLGSFIFLLGFSFFPQRFSAQDPPRVVHFFVALADNAHQGIVPVPARLGDGEVPANNLYWGAAYGVKTYFRASADWELLSCGRGPKQTILERCIFRFRKSPVYLIADAYEGSKIREAVTDFLSAAAGLNREDVSIKPPSPAAPIVAGGGSDLVVYVGHDAFMDFQIPPIAGKAPQKPRQAIILACASKYYFAPYLKQTGAAPLLWTTNLMAPEAYTLKAALDGWIAREDESAIRLRAAQAYGKYQKCSVAAAQKLFATGW
jgi:hypothetical protein